MTTIGKRQKQKLNRGCYEESIACNFAYTLFFLTVAIYGQDFDLDIRAAILVESETGQVLYEKNSAEPLPPASITKIMTLLIAMEEVEKEHSP